MYSENPSKRLLNMKQRLSKEQTFGGSLGEKMNERVPKMSYR